MLELMLGANMLVVGYGIYELHRLRRELPEKLVVQQEQLRKIVSPVKVEHLPLADPALVNLDYSKEPHGDTN